MLEYRQLNSCREICRDVENAMREQIERCSDLPHTEMQSTFLRVRSDQLEEMRSIRKQLEEVLTVLSRGTER